MNTSGDADRDAEAARVGRTYAGYARSRRRRRAWDAENPGNRAMRAELLAALLDEAAAELEGDGEILDIGCGTGFWLEALADSGVDASRLTGVDILPERVAAAATRVPNATVEQADAKALRLEANRFTVILMFTVLSSLERDSDVRHALSEARRVLAPGGLMLVYEPRLRNPFNAGVRRVTDEDLDVAGLSPRTERRLTLLPPLARRLGARTPTLYPRLNRLAPLRTHRLVAYRSADPA